jgi:predicted MFS family arabinose efflux permease
MQGVFFATADLSMMVYLMDIMPSERTGMVMGLYSEAENVGGIIAAPSLGYVYDSFSPGYATIAVALVLILDSILSIYFIKANNKKNFEAISSSDQEKLEGEKSG